MNTAENEAPPRSAGAVPPNDVRPARASGATAALLGSGPMRWSAVVSYMLVASCLVLEARAQWWFAARRVPIGIDEGYMGALALRLIDGHMLPGVDGVGQRGPVLYWIVTLFQLTFGPYRWLGFRVLAWLASALVMLSLLAMGTRQRRPMAGAIGAAFYVYTLLHQYDLGAGVGVTGELVTVPWLCIAAALTGFALHAGSARKRHALCTTAGAFAALAGWTKVTFLGGIAPLALWVLADSLRGTERSWRATVAALRPLLVGWLLPNLAIILIYASTGHLDQLIYRFFVYNRDIHMGVYDGVRVAPLIASWLHTDTWTACTWLGCSGALLYCLGYQTGRTRGRGVIAMIAATELNLIVLLYAAMGFASGIVQMRFWPHHFVAALPWAGLALGLALEALGATFRPKVSAAFAIVLQLAVAGMLVITVGQDLRRRELERSQGAWSPARKELLCKAIRRYSRADDYIYVWGFDADLYVSCQRRPATRFVYTTPVAGIVPPFWDVSSPERVARGAVRETLADLRKTKPTLIVNPIDWPGRIPVTAIPELKALIEADYCELKDVDGSGRRGQLFARKPSSHCGKGLASSE